jgi:hypothetical protein
MGGGRYMKIDEEGSGVITEVSPGKRITMSTRRLKAQSLPDAANNILITTVTGDGHQVGHCIVSQWIHRGDRVWWITQLIVQPEYRD